MPAIRCCGRFAKRLGRVSTSTFYRCPTCKIVYGKNAVTKKVRRISEKC